MDILDERKEAREKNAKEINQAHVNLKRDNSMEQAD